MGESLSQDDLNALFDDISLETEAPQVREKKEMKDVENIESLDGGDNLTQDQIDELLKTLNGD